MKMTNKRGLVAAAVLIAMVFFIIDKGILSRERFVQLSKTEYEISSSKDWKNGIPKTKVNITAQLSLEDKTSAAVHKPSTLPVASNIPHVHPNLHPDNLTLINITNFKININYDICNVSQIGLVTIIHSAVPNKQARSAIRETWGNPSIPGVNTRLVFLLGMASDSNAQNSVMSEALQYKDIVQGDFLDTYRNLSYKSILGKLWVSTFCEQADFVVKADDDVFVDLYATYFFTRQYLESPEYKNNSFILCRRNPASVLRNPNSKWYVSYDELSKEEGANGYPPYCTGFIYILNPGTAARLVTVAQTTKFFWIDDAWVTGFLVKVLKFTHLDMEYFLSISMKNGLLRKSIQNPEIYHKDFLAVLARKNYKIFYTLNQLARWCYFNKCFNNIYNPKTNLSNIDVMAEDVIHRELE